jgi:hypothetical protein
VSLYLNIVFEPDDMQSRQLGTNKGVNDFCTWGRSLPSRFRLLRALARGRCRGGKELVKELQAALKAKPPGPSAGSVARRLLAVLPFDDAELFVSDDPCDGEE